jgi:hypothetical protein
MQRRAVVVYVALFLLVGSASGVLLTTAETPEVAFENPEFELSAGDTFEVDGQEYTVSDVTETETDEGETQFAATIERDRTVERSETWANGSTVELDDEEWRVRTAGENSTSVTLVEVLDRQAILEEDPDADNATVERDGGEFVVVDEGEGDPRLVPADEYFPDPAERSYAVGDEFEYGDRTVTVDSIAADGAVLVWTASDPVTTELTHSSTATIGDTEFAVAIPDGSTLALSTDIQGYEAQLARIDRFGQQSDGLWRMVIISFLASGLLGTTAFMPSRY